MKRTLAILTVAGLVLGGGAAAFAATTGGGPGSVPVPRARRQEAKACIRQARADHQGDRAAIRAAAKECLQRAGVHPGTFGRLFRGVRAQIRALSPEKRAALKDCVKQARRAHKGDRAGFRQAAEACLSQAGITLPAPTS